MTSTRIELLGEVAVTHDGVRRVVRGAQPRTVLTMLVHERRRSVSRDEIGDALWPDQLPDHWSGAVRGVVAKVRSALSTDDADGAPLRLVTTQDGWCLEADDGVEFDLELATLALDRAEQLMTGQSIAALGSAHELALRAARSLSLPLAPGTSGGWIERCRNDVDRLARRAWVAAATTALASGRNDQAVRAAAELRARDPYDESAVRLQLRAHLAVGDRAQAVAVHDEFVRLLHDELGVDPDLRTTALITEQGRGVGTASVGSTTHRRSPFVGREEPMERLRSSWYRVAEIGRAGAAIVIGEPGAGKTRLVEEFVGDPATIGAAIRWGACSPDAAPSYQPVLMALPRSVEQLLRDHAGGSGGRPPEDLDRSVLFLELAELLSEVIEGPTILVVDDAHWADADTRALLSHLARVLSDRPLLWVFTTRSRQGEVDQLFTTFARTLPTEWVELEGLATEAVEALLRNAGVDDAAALGVALRERTGGNPLFVEELVALVGADGTLPSEAVPASLARSMEQRIGELTREARDLLTAASVVGMELDLPLLADVLERDIWEVLALCEQLVDGRWLVQLPGGRLQFRHALTRDAVGAGLGAARRALLHARVARVLAGRPDVDSAALAEHLACAGPDVNGEAVTALAVAGDEALARSAWSSAAEWYERAAQRAGRDDRAAARALIGLGRARRGLGDRAGGRAAFERSLALAASIGDVRLAASATLGLVGGGARGVSDSLPDAARAALLRTALEALLSTGGSTADDDLVVPLQLELALALLLTDHVEDRRRLVEDALARARQARRPELLVEALLGARLSLTPPELDEERVRRTDEALGLARGTGRTELVLAATIARHEEALLLGDRRAAARLLDDATELANRHDHPYWRWVTTTWTALGHLIDGELDAAEVCALDAVGLQSDHPEAMACLGVNLVDLRLFQGRSSEVVDLLRAAADDNPHIPCYRAVLALCLAESGDLAAAEVEYRHFSAAQFGNLPEDSNLLLALVVLADVAASLHDATGAATMLGRLEPHGHRQALLNCFGGGGAYWGPVATQLGRLHSVTGDTAAAQRWFDTARRSAARFGAPLAAARIPD